MRRARPLLGTVVEIQTPGLDQDGAARAIDAAFLAVEAVQQCMSFHNPKSMLSRLNRLAARHPVQVDAQTYQVLECARQLHEISGGLFDVGVAPRLQALGFLPTHHAIPKPLHGPAETRGFSRVELLPDCHVRFLDPHIALDLGGIAKGYAVDQAIAALRSHGVPAALVNAGGDLRSFGPDGFVVSIRHPSAPDCALATLCLRNAALATSAHYFAERLVPGSVLGPIVDPASGRRAESVASASVHAESAMVADALTKVVMLGGQDALPVLAHFKAEALLVAMDGQTLCSPGWHAALHL